MLSVNQKNFVKVVLESPQPVLVHFWAPWCEFCHLINPLLLKFQSKWDGQLKLVGINVDANFQLANRYCLKNLPTLIVFDRGTPVYRLEDFEGRDYLQRQLNALTIGVLLQIQETSL